MLFVKLFLIFSITSLFATPFTLTKSEKVYIKTLPNKYQIANRFHNFYKFFAKAKKFNRLKQLERTSIYVNRIISKNDAPGTNEWITPKEFLIRGRGDCEDYAITKYFALKTIGVDTKKLYLAVVKLKGSSSFHMVLLYDDGVNYLVLDNLSWKVLPLSKRKDLTFFYAFNDITSYIFKDGKLIKEKRKKQRAEVKKFQKMIKKVKSVK